MPWMAIYLCCSIAQQKKFPITDKLLNAIEQVESGGNRQAISPKGAKGPYQFMDATWREWGIRKCGFQPQDVFDETKARKVCQVYLTWEYDTITKWQHKPATLEQIIASYNGGIGNLRKCKFNWRAMPKESVNYVHKVERIMNGT